MRVQPCEFLPPPIAAAAFINPTVLVLDDDEHFRDLARKLLEMAGFQVIEAEHVAQAMAQLQSRPVDAIVLDIVMPDRDGIEALKEIKGVFPRTKVVTVSGASHAELFLHMSDCLGADASLEKSNIASLALLLDVVLAR